MMMQTNLVPRVPRRFYYAVLKLPGEEKNMHDYMVTTQTMEIKHNQMDKAVNMAHPVVASIHVVNIRHH
jgi:hypothetical protein